MLSLVSILFGALFALAIAYSLGVLCMRRLPAPASITLAVGVAVESLLVFLLLLAGFASPVIFALAGAGALIPLLRLRVPTLKDPTVPDAGRALCWVAVAIFAAYAALYLVHALAPEIQPDGITYHLGLVAEYARLGAFSRRVTFYHMVPQGLEMVFLLAFAFGRHSAAKLVHFALLLATVPLILRIGRRMHVTDTVSIAATLLYFCAPVVGVTGASSYNDAGLVFFVLAVFYLLLVWDEQRDDRYLLPAGLLAGFCFAIKFPGIMVLPLAACFVLWRRRNPLPLLAAGLAMFAPWMIRNAVLTGNPLAPLFNRWFPNPYFHALTEEGLARTLRTLGGFTYRTALFDVAVGGRLQGVFGPVFLAFPLGVLALRRRAGRWCWFAAVALALPWFWNHGARFLMPALPFLAFAFAMILPRPAAMACFVLQAVLCWPAVFDLWNPGNVWRLRGFPWQAALRLQPESEYLWTQLHEYKVARLVEDNTKPGDRIFSLIATPAAYVTREVLDFWHSAEADVLLDALRVGGQYIRDPFHDVAAAWPPQPVTGVRVRARAPHTGEWCLHELRLYLDENQIYSSPRWRFRAWPNAPEVALAFDANLATRWRTWQPLRAGMYVEADFDRPQLLSRAIMATHTPPGAVPFEFYGRGPDGKWRMLCAAPQARRRESQDLRMSATHAVRQAGFQYILAPTQGEGLAPLGSALAEHPLEWGVERIAETGHVCLFRVR